MLSAVLRIESPDPGMILETLGPEAGRELPRTKVSVGGDGGSVTVSFEAADSTALRAALNSYLGFIKITEDISKITGE